VNYWPLEDPPPQGEASEADTWHALDPPAAEIKSATFLVPQALLEDMADMNDLLDKVFRGEIELKPSLPPKRHRCLACWLVSLLPGHDRCEHGHLESGCEACEDW
jgi:hypothetical protein